MALFRRFFYRKPPDRLLEISERVYVFDCCFSIDVLDEEEYNRYIVGIVAQLQDHFRDAGFMVFNFKERDKRSQLSEVLSQYNMTVMDYPQLYEGCPLLPLETIHHFLRSSESWLSVESQQNVLLVHCERGGWPVLAFMLAGLLLYRKQYTGEMKTLEMVYKQAPRELLHLWTPLNPQPSQLRYLQYICRRNFRLDWPQSDKPLSLDCVILRNLPLYNVGRECRPVARVYGPDPSCKASSRSSKLLFSTTKVKKHIRVYQKEECELVKLDIHCRVQGDIVLEFIHLEDDLMTEEIMFRIMFHTEFVRSNVIMLTRDEVDVLWDAKDQIPREFRAEVLFLDADSIPSIVTSSEALAEDDSETEAASPEEFFEAEEIFSSVIDTQDSKGESSNDMTQISEQGYDESHNELDNENHHEVENETHHEVKWKDGLEQHAFQDCASDEAINKLGHEVDPNSRLLLNGDNRLDYKPVIEDVAGKANPKFENYCTHEKSNQEEDHEGMLAGLASKAERKSENDSTYDEPDKKEEHGPVIVDVTCKTKPISENDDIYDQCNHEEDLKLCVEVFDKMIEKTDTQQELAANNNKQKLDKVHLTVQKKQPDFGSKSAIDIGTTKKSKQQDQLGHIVRQAKPTAVSRWIPSNKGSYTNSMHVYYPQSRPKSAPAVLAACKDSQSWVKSKPQSASSNRDREKHASCPSSLDLSLSHGPSRTLYDVREVSPELTQTSHSPPPALSPPPPPPPPPPLSPPPLSSRYSLNTLTTPPGTIPLQGESWLPPPTAALSPLPLFSCESTLTVLPSRSPPTSRSEDFIELSTSNINPLPSSSLALLSTNTSLMATLQEIPSPPAPPQEIPSPLGPPVVPTSGEQNVSSVFPPSTPYAKSSSHEILEESSCPTLPPSSPLMQPNIQNYRTIMSPPHHAPPQTLPSHSVPAPPPLPPLFGVPVPVSPTIHNSPSLASFTCSPPPATLPLPPPPPCPPFALSGVHPPPPTPAALSGTLIAPILGAPTPLSPSTCVAPHPTPLPCVLGAPAPPPAPPLFGASLSLSPPPLPRTPLPPPPPPPPFSGALSLPPSSALPAPSPSVLNEPPPPPPPPIFFDAPPTTPSLFSRAPPAPAPPPFFRSPTPPPPPPILKTPPSPPPPPFSKSTPSTPPPLFSVVPPAPPPPFFREPLSPPPPPFSGAPPPPPKKNPESECVIPPTSVYIYS